MWKKSYAAGSAIAATATLLSSTYVALGDEQPHPSTDTYGDVKPDTRPAWEMSGSDVDSRARLSTGPGLQDLPLLPRGGGHDEIFAGTPECVPLNNDSHVGRNGGVY